jgi:hypothetical protein
MTDMTDGRGRSYQIEALAKQVAELVVLTREIQTELAKIKGGLGLAKWLGGSAMTIGAAGFATWFSHAVGWKSP